MPAFSSRRIAWTLAAMVAVAAAAGALLPYAAASRLVSGRIAEEMSAWSGLDVAFAAPPEISVWPGLQATLTDVTLSRRGGDVVATAERVEIELSALAALTGGIDFSKARFLSPTIRWRDGAPPALPVEGRIASALGTARELVAENRAAPDKARLPAEKFGAVEFSQGRIVAVTGNAETEVASGLAGRIDWGMLNGRGSATAQGMLLGEAFTLEFSSDSPLLFFGGAATPARLGLTSDAVKASFEGVASLGDNFYAEGRSSFSAPSLRHLLDWPDAAAADAPAAGAITVDSDIMADRARVRLEDASITLGGKPAHGALDVLLSGSRPKLSGTIAFDALDLVPFLAALTRRDLTADGNDGVTDADFTSRLDLDLRLSAARATAGTIALADMAATARVDETLAAFDISDASALGGNIQAGLRVDRKAAGMPVELRLLASDVDGAAFSAAMGNAGPMPEGSGTISVILKGKGDSREAFLAHANGSISASFGPGPFAGLDISGLVDRARAGAPFALAEAGDSGAAIEAFDIKAAVADGAATIERGEIRSTAYRVSFVGTATLAGGMLRLAGRAQAPQPTAGSAEPPGTATFLVEGPWDAATVTPGGPQGE